MNEVIPAALAGERLDRVVALITGASRAEAAALVAAGRVEVNGVTVTARAHRLDEHDVVDIDYEVAASQPTVEPDPSVDFEVLHSDPDLLVIDKPAGLVVHPGAGHTTGTLVNGLVARYPEIADVGDPLRPGIVHRLDKDTSGLMLVARSPVAYEALVDALGRRAIERRYLTLVWGGFDTPTGLIDAPIGRSGREPTRMAVSARGREARTRYEVVERFDEAGVTLLACRLETGRTHQIRVHLAAIGHPVVGDGRYRGDRQQLAVPRLFLHAAGLELVHPTSGERLAFESPLPPDLRSVLDVVRRPNR
jgi:23S rRNA pseudouridine1911/1915/1917 synthase